MIKLTDIIDSKYTIKPEVLGVFPSLDSLIEVVELGNSKLPITSKNDLFILLMVYHNTLLKELKCK